MENNHGLGVTPCSCHAKSFMDLAKYPRKVNPIAIVAIPSRQRWQTTPRNLSSAVNSPEGCPASGEIKLHCLPSCMRELWSEVNNLELGKATQ